MPVTLNALEVASAGAGAEGRDGRNAALDQRTIVSTSWRTLPRWRRSPSARATRSVSFSLRSTSRNNSAPPFEEIEPPEKSDRTRRRRHSENDSASWFHFVTVWFLVRSSLST